MENNKIRKTIIYLFIIFLFSSCEDKKTEVFKIHIDVNRKKRERMLSEYFIINNPPEDFPSIILFYKNELKKFSLKKGNEFLKDQSFYYQSYYKERFFFDRNYKEPKPDYGRILNSDFFFDTRSVDVSHADDLFIDIYFKDDNSENLDAPITPYLYIHAMNLYYYPNGLKNNPDIHWETRISKSRDSNYDVLRF